MSKSYIKASLNTVKFSNYLKRLDRMSQIAAKEGLHDALEYLSDRIIEQTPKDTRTLVNSFSYQIIDQGNIMRAHFGFGIERDEVNPKTGQRASEYVLAVHEDLEASHTTGKAKFLEDPVNQFRKQYMGIASMTIRRRLKGVKR